MGGVDPSLAAARERGTRLLLASLDPRDQCLAGLDGGDLDGVAWEWLIARARRHKVLPLFAARMEAHGYLDALPARTADALREARTEAVGRARKARRTLLMVSEICDELDVPFFVVKGSFLAEQVYGDPALRSFSDVDVVIPKEHMAAVDRSLRDRGYYFFYNAGAIYELAGRRLLRAAPPDEEPGSPAAARRLMLDLHRHWLFVLKEGDPRLHVELHWHIAVPGQMKVDAAEVWEETHEIALAGSTVRTLKPEAALLHCAVHAMEHSPVEFRLLHLNDVVWIADRLGAQLRMSVLRNLARRWGVERYLECAVLTAEALFPHPVPELLRGWSGRSPWARSFLRVAGMNGWLVGQTMPDSRIGRLVSQLRGEAFWELALRRRAGTALRTGLRFATARFRRSAEIAS